MTVEEIKRHFDEGTLFDGVKGGLIPRDANARILVPTKGNAVLFGVSGDFTLKRSRRKGKGRHPGRFEDWGKKVISGCVEGAKGRALQVVGGKSLFGGVEMERMAERRFRRGYLKLNPQDGKRGNPNWREMNYLWTGHFCRTHIVELPEVNERWSKLMGGTGYENIQKVGWVKDFTAQRAVKRYVFGFSKSGGLISGEDSRAILLRLRREAGRDWPLGYVWSFPKVNYEDGKPLSRRDWEGIRVGLLAEMMYERSGFRKGFLDSEEIYDGCFFRAKNLIDLADKGLDGLSWRLR